LGRGQHSSKRGRVADVIETVTQSVKVPIIAKLTPQVSDIVEVAKTAVQAGAAAVTISHRFQGMIIDYNCRIVKRPQGTKDKQSGAQVIGFAFHTFVMVCPFQVRSVPKFCLPPG
jgi:dihydroorotate dehydrogenase